MEQFRRPMIVDCHLQRERDLHRQQRSTTGFGDRRPELSKVILTLAMLRYDRSMMAIAGDIGFLDFSPPPSAMGTLSNEFQVMARGEKIKDLLI